MNNATKTAADLALALNHRTGSLVEHTAQGDLVVLEMDRGTGFMARSAAQERGFICNAIDFDFQGTFGPQRLTRLVLTAKQAAMVQAELELSVPVLAPFLPRTRS